MTHIDEYLSRLESWLDKKGFTLCKSKKVSIEDEVEFERKVVFLSLRSSPINQLFSLLHECGHIVIRNRKDYEVKYKESFKYQQQNKKPTMRACVEEIEEEISAWREGEKLAQKLSIYVDSDAYYRYASKWVMSYVVLHSVGNEHLLPSLKDLVSQEDKQQEQEERDQCIDLCKLLDNAHEPC